MNLSYKILAMITFTICGFSIGWNSAKLYNYNSNKQYTLEQVQDS